MTKDKKWIWDRTRIILKHQADTRKKFEKWLEECPVMYAHIEFMDENIVSYKFKITKRRNK